MADDSSEARVLSSSLKRVVRILERAVGTQGTSNSVETWATLLGLEWQNHRQLQIETARALAVLSEEVDRAYLSLKGTPLNEDDYKSSFELVYGAISLQQALGNNWDPIRNLLSGPVMGMMRTAATMAPATEALLSETELREIESALKDLRLALEALPEDDALAVLFREQHRRMQRALAHYKIAGTNALVHEVLALEAAVQSTQEMDTSPETSAVRKRAASLGRKVWGVIVAASIFGDALEGPETMARLARKANRYLIAEPVSEQSEVIDYEVEDEVPPSAQADATAVNRSVGGEEAPADR